MSLQVTAQDELVDVSGPCDAELREAHAEVQRAQQELKEALDHRAEVMIAALEEGYSVYLLGILTGRRRPTSVYRDLRRFDR